MSIDEYYLAFEAILYGLIISTILVKWAEMIKNGNIASYNWSYILLTVNIFILIVYLFWVNRVPEHYEKISGPIMFFIMIALPPSIFTFMTYQVFPRDFSNVDQEEYLLKYRKHIFIPWAIYLIYNVSVLSNNLLHPSTVFTFAIIILIGFIIKFPKFFLIKIFVIVHTVLMTYSYLRPYLF